MISGLVAFLSSSAGGALFRLILQWLSKREEDEKAKRQLEHENRLSKRGHLIDYQREMHKVVDVKPVKVRKHVKRSFPLLGTYEYEKEKEIIPRSFRSVGNTWILGMLAATYCFVLLIFADNPTYVVWTWDPDSVPNSASILFGIISWEVSSKSVIEVTTGGIAYVMAWPLNFILTAWLTGLPFTKYRK